MSDDFDNDLSWLNDDDDGSGDGDEFDELADLDWLSDDDEGGSGGGNDDRTGLTGALDWQKVSGEGDSSSNRGQQTGLTGQLSWQQGSTDEGGAGGDDDDGLSDLDWLQDGDDDSPSSRDEGRTGVTGQLDWQKVQQQQSDDFEAQLDAADAAADEPPSEDAGDDVPDWMQGLDDQLAGSESMTREVDFQGDLPTWAQEMDSDTDELAAQRDAELQAAVSGMDDGSADDVPEWMQGLGDDDADDEFIEDAPADDDVPDWMSGGNFTDEPIMGDDDDGDGVPDWMQGGSFEEEDPATDFGQFGADDASADDDVPDWMQQGGSFEEEDPATDFGQFGADDDADDALDWMSGDPVDDVATDDGDFDDDLPSWMTGDAVPDSPAAMDTPVNDVAADDDDFDDELPPWMTGDTEAVAAESSDALFDDADDDLFGDVDDDDLGDLFEQAEDVDDLLGVAEQTPPDFDNLFGDDDFAGLDDGGDDAFDLLGDSGDDDLDALLGGDDDGEFDLFGELTDEDDDLGGLFDDAPVDDAAPAMDFGDDDALFAGFDDSDDLPVAEAEQAIGTDELDQLFGEDDGSIPPSNRPDDEFMDALSGGVDDDFGGLFDEDDADDERMDWFGEDDAADLAPAASLDDNDSELDWLQDIEDIEDANPLADIPEPEPQKDYDVDDFLATLGGDSEMVALPQTGDLNYESGADFESLFGDDDSFTMDDDDDDADASRPELAPDAPDWLADLSRETAGKTSAAAIVRQQQDRPVDELPDRLKALRDRGLELKPQENVELDDTSALNEVLGNVKNALPAASFDPAASAGIVSAVTLTDEQMGRAQVLRSVAGSSIDLEADVDAKPRRRLRIGGRDRTFISILIVIFMVMPFIVDTAHFGDLPPAVFAAGGPEAAFVANVDAVPAGSPVLVAVEFGPTGAAELDDATEALLLHVLQRGGRPVIVGGNPVGLLRANALMTEIAETNALTKNFDYVVGSYLVGDVIGLRAFNENLSTLIETDIRGESTGIDFLNTVDDFALVVVITESADRARVWAEQVMPNTSTPLIAITGQGAGPLTEPYYGDSFGITGLLVGYEDGYTYRNMVDRLLTTGDMAAPVLPTSTPTETPTEEVTAEAAAVDGEETETPAVEATEPVDPADATATEAVIPPTDTPQATATPAPTDPPATPTIAPTNTPQPTATPMPTATPEPIRIAVVTASQAVNVRSGPSTAEAAVASLRPGEQALVIGENEDGTWVNILLDDATEGWISATLVSIEIQEQAPPPTATPPTDEASTDEDSTAEATPEPVESDLIEVGIVIADGAINVRSGPSTSDSIVTTLEPGTFVPIIGRNADESWFEIELPDGGTAWAAEFLLRVELITPESGEDDPEPTPTEAGAFYDGGKGTVYARVLNQDPTPTREGETSAEATPEATPEPTAEATVEATEEPTAEITPEAVVPPVDTLPSLADRNIIAPERDNDDLRDERWFSMTIGIIVAALIIGIGNLFNVLRAFRRRNS